jgi:hypothetical protein
VKITAKRKRVLHFTKSAIILLSKIIHGQERVKKAKIIKSQALLEEKEFLMRLRKEVKTKSKGDWFIWRTC